jgi:hypothetical protein
MIPHADAADPALIPVAGVSLVSRTRTYGAALGLDRPGPFATLGAPYDDGRQLRRRVDGWVSQAGPPSYGPPYRRAVRATH